MGLFESRIRILKEYLEQKMPPEIEKFLQQRQKDKHMTFQNNYENLGFKLENINLLDYFGQE